LEAANAAGWQYGGSKLATGSPGRDHLILDGISQAPGLTSLDCWPLFTSWTMLNASPASLRDRILDGSGRQRNEKPIGPDTVV
jgi:hypothetical protein